MVQSVRHRTRTPNIAKPIPPHWLRAVTLKVTKTPHQDPFRGPISIEKYHMKRNQPRKMDPGIEDNPFEKILAKEFMERIERSRLIAICHRYPTDEQTRFSMKITLKKSKMEYLQHNNKIVTYAFKGTKYEAASCLYVADTCTVVSDEPAVGKLLKMEKKIPGLIVLAALVDGCLMSTAELKRYAQLPPLEVLQGQLVGILGAPAQRLSHNVQYHQMELSSALGRYVSDQNKPEEGVAAETATEAAAGPEMTQE